MKELTKAVVGLTHAGKTMKMMSLVVEELDSNKDSNIIIISGETSMSRVMYNLYSFILGYSILGEAPITEELKIINSKYDLTKRVRVIDLKENEFPDTNGEVKLFVDDFKGNNINEYLDYPASALSMNDYDYRNIMLDIKESVDVMFIEATNDGIFPYFKQVTKLKDNRRIGILGGKDYIDSIMLGRKLAKEAITMSDEMMPVDKNKKVEILEIIRVKCEDDNITLWSLLLRTNTAKAGGESNRLIKQFAVKINDKIVTDVNRAFVKGDTFDLKVGSKRHFHIIIE